jgi:hypothetical protein
MLPVSNLADATLTLCASHRQLPVDPDAEPVVAADTAEASPETAEASPETAEGSGDVEIDVSAETPVSAAPTPPTIQDSIPPTTVHVTGSLLPRCVFAHAMPLSNLADATLTLCASHRQLLANLDAEPDANLDAEPVVAASDTADIGGESGAACLPNMPMFDAASDSLENGQVSSEETATALAKDAAADAKIDTLLEEMAMQELSAEEDDGAESDSDEDEEEKDGENKNQRTRPRADCCGKYGSCAACRSADDPEQVTKFPCVSGCCMRNV